MQNHLVQKEQGDWECRDFCFCQAFRMKKSRVFADCHHIHFDQRFSFLRASAGSLLTITAAGCSSVLQNCHCWRVQRCYTSISFLAAEARRARQTMCIEILSCRCLASCWGDYFVCLTVNSSGNSIGTSITEGNFEDVEDLCLKCQWLLNYISYFQ